MSIMSIREFNANISRTLAKVEAGEDVVLTRNGRPTVRLTREDPHAKDERRRSAIEQLRKMMDQGFDFGGPATYEERTGR